VTTAADPLSDPRRLRTVRRIIITLAVLAFMAMPFISGIMGGGGGLAFLVFDALSWAPILAAGFLLLVPAGGPRREIAARRGVAGCLAYVILAPFSASVFWLAPGPIIVAAGIAVLDPLAGPRHRRVVHRVIAALLVLGMAIVLAIQNERMPSSLFSAVFFPSFVPAVSGIALLLLDPRPDPRAHRTLRRVVAAFLVFGPMLMMLSTGRVDAISLLFLATTIGAAGLMLLGPLRHTRLRAPIAALPPDGEPAPCADCGYMIQPPASPVCPECGGSDVGRRPAPGWQWFGRAGELGLLALTLIPTVLGVMLSATFEEFGVLLVLGLAGVVGIPVIGVPAVILQLGTRGRVARWWIPTAGLIVAVSVALTDWPAAAVWQLSRADAEALHARVIAGETIDLPVRLAGRDIVRIDRRPDGAVGYLVSGQSTGFFRTPAPATSSPGWNTWSESRLGRLWWFHLED
jgi:hypothetical protein